MSTYAEQIRDAGLTETMHDLEHDDQLAKQKKRRIRTQQGFSQHTLTLTEEDARIYIDLLTRNNLWWADVTERD